MKKILKIGLGIIVLCFLLSNLLFGWPMIKMYNDYLTGNYLNSLKQTTYPKSRVINHLKRFGILHGASNHCDCEIAVLIESDLMLTEFEKFCQKIHLVKAPFSSLGENYSEIYYVKGEQLFRIYEGDAIALVQIKDWPFYTIDDTYEFYLEADGYQSLKNLIEPVDQKKDKNYYIITAFDQTYSGISMYDIRCN